MGNDVMMEGELRRVDGWELNQAWYCESALDVRVHTEID